MSSRPIAPSSPTRAQPGKRRLGVLVADTSGVVRAGVGLLLSGDPSIEVLGLAASEVEVMTLLSRLRRRSGVVLLLGSGLTGSHDSYRLIHDVRGRFPAAKILAHGWHRDTASVCRALWAGVDGFIDMSVGPIELLDAIGHAAGGEMVLAGVPADVLGSIAEGIERQREYERMLSIREREVLCVAAEGVSVREIADRLGVRERTVSTHLGSIYRKLGVRSRVAAITVAARAGIVSVGG